MRLTLIRHGQTDWNLQGRWQGHADEPLNELGRQQAVAVAQRIVEMEHQHDAIISSDLSRASDTALHVAGAVGLPLRTTALWRELDLGKWSGLTKQQVSEHYADELAQLRAGADLPRGGGEREADMDRRIESALSLLKQEFAGKRVIVVTHGGPVRAALRIMRVDRELAPGFSLAIDNASITTVSLVEGVWRLDHINDTAHLKTLASATDLMAQREGQA
jgi:broad specificity phosphatase PhoE